MSKKSYIYILLHGENKMFKIGKANSLKERIYSLKNTWGNFNLEESYSISCDEKDVYNLENMIHLVLKDYRIKLDSSYGNGYTEFFTIEGLSKAIGLCSNFSNSDISLNKNIIIRNTKKSYLNIDKNRNIESSYINNEIINILLNKNYIFLNNSHLSISNKYELKLLLFLLLVEKQYGGKNVYKYKTTDILKLLKLPTSKYHILYDILNNIKFANYSQERGYLFLKLNNLVLNPSFKIENISLNNILKFKKIYSLYLYIHLNKCINNKYLLYIKYIELRKILVLDNKYYRFFDFKKKVLLYSQNEFKGLGNFSFDFIQKKEKRQTIGIEFSIKKNATNLS